MVTRQKRGNVHRQFEHGASTSISYITHAFVHGRSSRGYTFEACIFGAVRVRYDVEEVVVHGSSWEVVVHVATVVEVVVLTTVVEVDVHGSSWR